MKTKILTSCKQDLIIAANIIKNGGVVAFPAETVYGLAANAFDKSAIEKIYNIKNRDKNKAILVLISNLKDVYKLSCDFNNKAQKLAKEFWPGPLTLILKKNPNVLNKLTANKPTIAVRFTSSKIALELMKYSGLIITAPSANTSGNNTATTKEQVLNDLNGKIDAIICDDNKTLGVESTIVDVTGEEIDVLREDAIKQEKILQIIKEN